MAKQLKSQAVTVAASTAGVVAKRFASVEAEASRIHAEQSGASLVRALLQGGKLHAVISDGKSTLEIMDGSVALSVAQAEADGN
jgi:hypothetical protein